MSLPCKKEDCLCPHEDCEYGWKTVEFDEVTERRTRDGQIITTTKRKEGAVPCPTCLPERAALFYKAQNSDELQRLLQKRSGNPKESNEPRTRIL